MAQWRGSAPTQGKNCGFVRLPVVCCLESAGNSDLALKLSFEPGLVKMKLLRVRGSKVGLLETGDRIIVGGGGVQRAAVPLKNNLLAIGFSFFLFQVQVNQHVGIFCPQQLQECKDARQTSRETRDKSDCGIVSGSLAGGVDLCSVRMRRGVVVQ